MLDSQPLKLSKLPFMRFLLSVTQSLDAIRSNMFRAGVTIVIIALGITALIGVLTSIEGIKSNMVESFSTMGANTLRVRNWGSNIQSGNRRGRRRVRMPRITYRQYRDFKEDFSDIGIVSVTGYGGGGLKVKYRNEETNQDIDLRGIDENFPQTARYDIAEGRHITEDDVQLARNGIVLGYDVERRLFPNSSAIGKSVTVRGHVYKVVGVYKKVGTSAMSGGDKIVAIPISTLRNHRPDLGSLTINIYVNNPEEMEYYQEEATGVFRIIRKIKPGEENDFAITKSDSFVERVMENLKVLTVSAQVIALITLLGASVALLNVMLVSVTERTNEIGLRKALGATNQNIMSQFLMEAIVICQVGGLLGILLGLPAGNLVSSLLLDGSFVVPWGWVMVGLIACFLVGVGAGIYPARKAANVDPIESLRHV